MAVHRSVEALRRPGSPAGLPRTWPEDTALDCLASLDGDEVAHLLLRLMHNHGLLASQLRRALGRRKRLRNRSEIASIISEGGAGSESGLEFVGLRNIFRRHGLPEPLRQARTPGGRTDLRLGPVLVELDGRSHHTGSAATFRDAAKDNANVLAGLATLRFGYADATLRSCLCAQQVHRLALLHGMTLPYRSCRRCQGAARVPPDSGRQPRP